MSTLTKEKWDSFSGKSRWDIMTALRGPDVHNPGTIKWYTSAVIRGAVRRVIQIGDGGAMKNTKLKLVILPDEQGMEIYGNLGPTGWNAMHFVEHINEAATRLTIPILWIPEQLWYQCFTTMGRKESAAKITAEYNGTQTKELTLLAKHLDQLKSGAA